MQQIILTVQDQERLEQFLQQHAVSSMFLRSNLKRVGLDAPTEPFGGLYAAAIEGGDIKAVACHCWNGILIVQAPTEVLSTVEVLLAQSSLPLTGILGPWQQVKTIQTALQLRVRLAHPEHLMTLCLKKLRLPEQKAEAELSIRCPTDMELEQLLHWRLEFAAEALNQIESPSLVAQYRHELHRLQQEQSHWVLAQGSRLLSYCLYNAKVEQQIQLGGVWTPPAQRNQGYARCVVAGAMQQAAARQFTQAILFTGVQNHAAQRVYQALGFQTQMEYGLMLCESGHTC